MLRPAPTRARRLVLLAVGLATALWPTATDAQTLRELTARPDAAAELFIRSVRSLRWGAAAQFTDPETLELFRDVVTMITEVEESGDLLRYLTDEDTAGYAALDAPEVFDRALTAVTTDMPGLSHSLFDREDEVLGHVQEGSDSAHVVYRTRARISGALPEVKVMQMRRGPEGWRVLWSDELDVLEAALRGARRLRAPPRPAGQAEPPRAPGPTSRGTRAQHGSGGLPLFSDLLSGASLPRFALLLAKGRRPHARNP